MPLSADKLGPYEILAPLGAGGMGEVYRGRDARLDRIVAIKVSKSEFSERFEREARAVAALNHPNVCTLHDIGPNYLVFEYVEGETLKGPLPLDTALRYAAQICEALRAAHAKKIIHRDLKPANILVTGQGVKLLDFGLAKIDKTEPVAEETLTQALTSQGQILGTLQYMSPEQLQGKEADVRSDIFSFGCVLYEMLTGKRAFEGGSQASVIAAILERPAPSLESVAPPALDRVLQRCLKKDPDERWQTAQDLKAELEWIAGSPANSASPPGTRPVARPSSFAWIVAGALGAALVAASWIAYRATRPPDSKAMVRLSADLGPEAVHSPLTSVILSPDGTRLVYAGKHAQGRAQLYTRRLDQASATVLPGTESAAPEPFFSPDGSWIGFLGTGKISKIPAEGGSPFPLAALSLNVVGASWGDDNNIILGTQNGLFRMPGNGGLVQLVKGTAGPMILPHVLPGSAAVLFDSVNGVVTGSLSTDFNVDVLDFASGRKKRLIKSGLAPRYLPVSANRGYLVFARETALFGVGFDPKRLELLNAPAPLLDDVDGSQTSFSNTGTLVYLNASDLDAGYPLMSLDSSGKTTPIIEKTGLYKAPRFSPDGKKLAYIAPGSQGFDVWVLELEKRLPQQLTFQGNVDRELAWARDSKHLIYGDGAALWWIRTDGSGQPQKLVDKMDNPRPFSIAPDGRLAFSPANTGLPDVWTIPIDATDPEHPKPGKAEPFLDNPAIVEVDPAFSPDGKFIAYAENDGSAEEVFVRPFPGPGGKWKVSSSGGKFPVWSAETHELLFLAADGRIMAASYTTQGDLFSSGAPRVWSPVKIRGIGLQQSFDISPDGKRAAMFPVEEAANPAGSLHATFLLNFIDEVRRRFPLR